MPELTKILMPDDIYQSRRAPKINSGLKYQLMGKERFLSKAQQVKDPYVSKLPPAFIRGEKVSYDDTRGTILKTFEQEIIEYVRRNKR